MSDYTWLQMKLTGPRTKKNFQDDGVLTQPLCKALLTVQSPFLFFFFFFALEALSPNEVWSTTPGTRTPSKSKTASVPASFP